ncbi:N-alpha-acetyltransferase, non-catalitic subunit [Malassezia sp. CBS 17886]|nr:N-alpha-acetyltransferase, non-catalitic subunit [Malassezia sp. CBS 17886]
MAEAPPGAPSRPHPADAFDDISASFWDACDSLAPEQLVHADGFTLHRLMNALEVMDPFTDAGMRYPMDLIAPPDRTAEGPVPLPATLSPGELSWAMDRLMACEQMAWACGAALSQTLYTCTYIHTSILPSPLPSGHWSYRVLHAYIVATLKGCSLQWGELMRHNVVDGEDFSGDLGNIPFPDGVSVDVAVAALNEARAETQALDLSPRDTQSLCVRLEVRKHWLLALESLCAPTSDGTRIGMQLSLCVSKMRLLGRGGHGSGAMDAAEARACTSTRDASVERTAAGPLPFQEAALYTAPPSARGLFDVTSSRRFSSAIPLRPLSLDGAEAVWRWWMCLWERDLCVVGRLMATDNVVMWLTYISSRQLAAGGTREIEHLCVNVLEETLGISLENTMVKLEWYQQRNTSSRIVQRTVQFVHRMASVFAQQLSALAQNRARQKRFLGKAYSRWADMADEALRLGHDVARAVAPEPFDPRAFCTVVQLHMMLQAAHAIGAGYDLDLYHIDERAAMYWVLAQVQAEVAVLCDRLASADRRALRGGEVDGAAQGRRTDVGGSVASHRAVREEEAALYTGGDKEWDGGSLLGRRRAQPGRGETGRGETPMGWTESLRGGRAAAAAAGTERAGPASDPHRPLAPTHREASLLCRADMARAHMHLATAHALTDHDQLVHRVNTHLHACAQALDEARPLHATDRWSSLCRADVRAFDDALRMLCAQTETHARENEVAWAPSGHPWYFTPMPCAPSREV